MKKLLSLFVIAILCTSYAFSYNIISNGNFELFPDKIAWLSLNTLPGNSTLSLETVAPISGTKSGKITITGAGTAPEQAYIDVRFSCAKGATYKVSFKAKAVNATTDVSTIPMLVKVTTGAGVGASYVNTFLSENVFLTSSAQSYDYSFSTTYVYGANVMTFNCGSFPVGTDIIIDDVVVEEVTFPALTDGNICYGDFETTCGTGKANGTIASTPGTMYTQSTEINSNWVKLNPIGQTFSATQSTTTPISGLKSFRIQMSGTPQLADSAYMVGWGFVPVLGSTYTCTFKAKSSVDFTAGMKIMTYDGKYSSSDKRSYFAITSTPQTFTYTSDPIKYYASFQILCFQVGTLPNAASCWIDDVVLQQTSAGAIAGTKQILQNDNVKVYGNNSTIIVKTPENAQANVYSISGQFVKKQLLVAGENRFSMTKGIYVVQIETPTAIINSSKVIVQ